MVRLLEGKRSAFSGQLSASIQQTGRNRGNLPSRHSRAGGNPVCIPGFRVAACGLARNDGLPSGWHGAKLLFLSSDYEKLIPKYLPYCAFFGATLETGAVAGFSSAVPVAGAGISTAFSGAFSIFSTLMSKTSFFPASG